MYRRARRRSVVAMTASASLSRTYLLECYKPGLERTDVESATNRALAASAELRVEGRKVEYVGAILVPEDEVVFHVFAAESAAAVCEASVRASLKYERVVESVAVGQLELRRKQAEPQPEL
jgi:hypothetical protein